MPVCPHRPPCPGCPRFAEPGIAAPALGALAALAAEAGLPPPAVVTGQAFGYRHRARLVVRGRATSPKIGIFQEGSHRIVDVPSCLVHHPLVNRVAAAVKTAVRRTGVRPYADATHAGLLRAVQIVVERASQRAQVVLVGNGETPEPLAGVAREVEAELGAALHSLWWNGNPERTNVILGTRWHRWVGVEAVRETIGGAAVFFPPGAFGQANLDLADRLVAQVHAWVPDGARVVELYAGVGAIGLGLVGRSARVVFNEVDAGSLAGLGLGVAALDPATQKRTEVRAGPAADHVAVLGEVDVAIVDPPRKGLDAPVLDALAADPPAWLVAVSCDLGAFLRETRRLLDAGSVRLAALVPFALFPNTAHVETVALFERR
jgi:tRNA/tmRNA/rRNA uracil-C5-methylase (TrmA/RlmC/RlmD family)